MVPATPADLFARLEALGLTQTTTTHAPVRTVEEAAATYDAIPGVHCKNLFLKDAKGHLWLVVCPHDRQVDLKTLHRRLGAARLSFGKPELLREALGVEPGAVTPFALLNDPDRRVAVVLDAWMMDQPLVNYHPLVNTQTTTIAAADLLTFLHACGHVPQVIDLAAPMPSP